MYNLLLFDFTYEKPLDTFNVRYFLWYFSKVVTKPHTNALASHKKVYIFNRFYLNKIDSIWDFIKFEFNEQARIQKLMIPSFKKE